MNKEEIKLSDKELQKCLNELQGTNFLNAFCVLDWILKTREENKELHNKIDKAIEYLETNGYGYDCCGDMCYFLDENNQKDLLEILKESDVDE